MESNTTPAPATVKTMPADEFHIGLTMAGAASAGCYTAGAMDYLFEILELWENAKKGILPGGWKKSILDHVSKHKVIIDVMGGTSAGGMTTVMSAIYALKGKINPVNDPADPTQKKNNLLYDSWVIMKDVPGKTKLFEKTLSTKDLVADKKIKSLLNSEFIDQICNDAFQHDNTPLNKPAYISDQLHMILSHTSLRSVPLAVDFSTPSGKSPKPDNPEHNTFNHFITSHFKLNYKQLAENYKEIDKKTDTYKNKEEDKEKENYNDKDDYLDLDPFGPGKATMKLATMATGAFPVGLRFREFFKNELPTELVKQSVDRIVNNRISTDKNDKTRLKWKDFPDPFDFVTIDGGAVNNEPYGEVLSVLKHHWGKREKDSDYRYALVMIDPFPDRVGKEEYKQPDDLFSVIPAIIGSIWDQSKLKRAEMLDAYGNDYYRGEIYPVRWKKTGDGYEKEDHPIACGAAMAFSGLLDINFRHHDFFLGRDNARGFFRKWFTLEYNPAKGIVHPIHKDWTPEMVEFFKKPGENGSWFLPIIPDLYMLKEKIDKIDRDPHIRTVAQWPEYDPQVLFAMEGKLKKRINKMFNHVVYKLIDSEADEDNPQTAKWIAKHFRTNWLEFIRNKIGFGILFGAFIMNKAKLVKRTGKMAFEWILKDLERKGLLKKIN